MDKDFLDSKIYWLCTEYLLGSRKNRIISMFHEVWDRFSYCPASTKYHGCYPGGLRKHTTEVATLCLMLAHNTEKDRESGGIKSTEFFNSLVFCALVHDLGKMGNPLDIGRKWPNLYIPDLENGRFKKNPELLTMEHELRSLTWLSHYNIEINDIETAAIYHHAGPYNKAFEYVKEFPLLMILHSADNLSAKVCNI